MTIEPTSVPAVEGAALGHDAVVDLRGRVEGELDAAAPEAAEEVTDDVELEESVQDDRHDDEGGHDVALRGHHRRRAEQQLAGRLAAGDVHWHRETEKLRLRVSDSGSGSRWGRISCGRAPRGLSSLRRRDRGWERYEAARAPISWRGRAPDHYCTRIDEFDGRPAKRRHGCRDVSQEENRRWSHLSEKRHDESS
jgi:hypothetical protein